jgi:hypothetical protein
MNKLKLICSATLVAMPLMCFSTGIRAQSQPPGTDAGRISETVRTVLYPEAIYPHGIVPDWDRGFVIHYEIDVNYSPETPMVVMYDNTGKRIREGRIWPQGAASVRIRRTAATRDGAILAAGWAVMQDGSTQLFIAKTSLDGNTVQTVKTGPFASEQICEAPDGTIWGLGKEVGEATDEADVLRHYSFEKGLLHSYLPEDTVRAVVRSKRLWFNPFGSFLRCGNEKVSLYLNFTDEYVEVATSSFTLKRWKLDEEVVRQGKANGLAVTEDGRAYVSFGATALEGLPLVRGLYQIKAASECPIAALLSIAGTITTMEQGEALPPGTFTRLWGADGNQLVVWRMEGDGAFLSWVNVIRNESTD